MWTYLICFAVYFDGISLHGDMVLDRNHPIDDRDQIKNVRQHIYEQLRDDGSIRSSCDTAIVLTNVVLLSSTDTTASRRSVQCCRRP